MFKHLNSEAILPTGRVVVLGSQGFVGHAVLQKLQKSNINCLGISRTEIDFLEKKSVELLTTLLKPDDILVIAIAQAPCKTSEMLKNNIIMIDHICQVLKTHDLSQVIYISSDAVYQDSSDLITEQSPTAPDSLHGVMHLAREIMLKNSVTHSTPLLLARPTLIYGESDPHNGYGPNKFRRLAEQNQDIQLFGKGEELRDHVYIEDVAKLIELCILYRSQGMINIVTGQTISFYEIAQNVIKRLNSHSEIICNPRTQVMPHNGYRAFDNQLIHQNFEQFVFRNDLAG